MNVTQEAVVYIPTRARAHLLKKVLPKWQEQKNAEVVLVVEGWEFDDIQRLAAPYANVWVEKLRRFDKGIAYARQQILGMAHFDGLDKIIMCDDDLYPTVESDVSKLLDLPDMALGMGASVSYYGLMFGNENLKRDDPLLCYNALGKRLFSIDVATAFEVGGYDVRLHTFGSDNDIVRQGAKDMQTLWYVHAGVKATSISKRYEPGGLQDFAGQSRQSREKHCHKIMHSKWPKYISSPDRRFACQWKKLMDDFIPDWKEHLNWRKT